MEFNSKYSRFYLCNMFFCWKRGNSLAIHKTYRKWRVRKQNTRLFSEDLFSFFAIRNNKTGFTKIVYIYIRKETFDCKGGQSDFFYILILHTADDVQAVECCLAWFLWTREKRKRSRDLNEKKKPSSSVKRLKIKSYLFVAVTRQRSVPF